jgi:DDE superfamily endonuclease
MDHARPASHVGSDLWSTKLPPLPVTQGPSQWTCFVYVQHRAALRPPYDRPLLTWSRDEKVVKRVLRKLLKKQGRAPRVLITDKLRSYGAAKREIMPGVEHRQHEGLNNRAENSHQPTRRREGIMKPSSRRGRCNGFFPPMIRLPFLPPPQPRNRRQISYRPQSSIHHLGRGHRRGHGCVITLVDSSHSNRRAFGDSIDNKLTVLLVPTLKFP